MAKLDPALRAAYLEKANKEQSLSDYAIINIPKMSPTAAERVLKLAKQAHMQFPSDIEAMLREKASEKREELPEV